MSTTKLPYHRKYRPCDISDMQGNIDIKTRVKTIMQLKEKPQIILLKGTAGCGKTSTARLLGKIYLCEHPSEDGAACGVCESCQLFNEYIRTGNDVEIPELYEYNCADINKETVSELIARIEEPLQFSNWRVFILDECHLLTQGAMGNLLKIFEEPPPNRLIVLCTTNPEKLLDTIHSRCQYVLKATTLTGQEMLNLLMSVCTQEKIPNNIKGLQLIAIKGGYTPRRCLVLLEDVYKAKGEATYSAVAEVVHEIEDKYYYEFLKLLHTQDTLRYMLLLGDIKLKYTINDFIIGLKAFIQRSLYIYYGTIQGEVDKSELKAVKDLFSLFNLQEISYIIHIILTISASPDIELELQKLGFDGLRPAWYLTAQNVKITQETDSKKIVTVAQEQEVATKNKIERLQMTEKEQKTICKLGEKLDIEALLKDTKKMLNAEEFD